MSLSEDPVDATDPAEAPEDGKARTCKQCGAEVIGAAFRYCTSCGAKLEATGPGAALVPFADDEDDEGPRWWRRWRKWVLMGTAVVVAVPVALYLSWQWSGLRTADTPVREFFAALEDLDGPAAAQALDGAAVWTGLADSEAGEDALASPLFGAAALETGYTPPTLVDVEVDYFADASGVEQRPDKSMAEAVATFTIGDDPTVWEWPFYLGRETSGFDRQWSIASVEMAKIGGVSDASVRIAGIETGPDAVAAPPGAYAYALENQALWEDAAGTVTVGGEGWSDFGPVPSAEGTGFADDGPIDLSEGQEMPVGEQGIILTWDLELVLRPEVQPAVEQAVRDQVEACAEPYQLDWDTCPFTLDDDSAIAAHIESAMAHGSEWTVTAWPKINLVTTYGFVQVQVTEPGRAEGVYLGPEDGSPGMVLLDEDYEAELIPYGRVGVDEAGNITFTYTP